MDWYQLEALADSIERQVEGQIDDEVEWIIKSEAAKLSRRDAMRLIYLHEARDVGIVDHALIDRQVEKDIAHAIAGEAN